MSQVVENDSEEDVWDTNTGVILLLTEKDNVRRRKSGF